MSDERQAIEHWSRAARPTLFDSVAEPRLIVALILADLMSPALWDFRDSVKERMEADRAKGTDDSDPTRFVLAEIGRYVDRHLYHVSPKEMGDIWGLVSLADERRRLGQETVDYAVTDILANLRKRQELGSFRPDLDIFATVEDGRFPEYEYANIDVIRAYRRLLKQKKHKPLGITCCVDEATLIAALAVVLGAATFEELLLIGAPVHYTTFFKHQGNAYWFNGKHEFYDKAAWQAQVALEAEKDGKDKAGGDPLSRALDRRVVLERLIAPGGTHLLRGDRSTLDPAWEARVFEALRDFFGGEPALIAASRARGIRYAASPDGALPFDELGAASDAASAGRILADLAARHPGSVFEAALYCHRHLDVARPEAYLAAARRGPKLTAAAAEVETLEDAMEIVRNIDGRDSIFAGRDRIALPDELLLFGTGSDRDRALLLASLLAEAPALAGAPTAAGGGPWEILFTATRSLVRNAAHCLDAESLSPAPRPEEPVVLRLSTAA